MENINNSAMELIKVVALNPKSLDLLVDTFIKQGEMMGKKLSMNMSKEELKKMLKSSLFLQESSTKLSALFTDKEILQLLKIYQSDVMSRFLSHSGPVFDALYTAMRKKIENFMTES